MFLNNSSMTFKKSFGRNELYEICNLPVLKYIVKNWNKFKDQIKIDKPKDNSFKYNPKIICQKYLSKYNKVAAIKYKKSNKYSTKFGRWFCNQGLGIQSMPKLIRHAICKDLYIDLDFKNCHPKILQTLCKNHNIDCKHLTNYIDNRDKLLQEWCKILQDNKQINPATNLPEWTTDDVKQIFLAALNGNKTHYELPNWYSIIEEFKIIHQTISTLPEYEKIYTEVEKEEKKNIHAKTVNRILCDVENRCLTVLYKNLDQRKLLNVEIDDMTYKVCALIFDGLQIPKNEYTVQFCTPENLKQLSFAIDTETGFYLDITEKPMNEGLTGIPSNLEEEDDDEDFILENDGDAAEYVVSKYYHLMVYCQGNKYVKKDNIWTCDEKIVKEIVYEWIYATPMKEYIPNADKYVFYNRNKTDINKCIDIIWNNWSKFEGVNNHSSFINDNLIKSKDYLPFTNGVYDIKNRKLMKYNDVPVEFSQQIDRDFPVYDEKYLKILEDKIIIPILPDPEERKYFIWRLARALAGHYEDKKWFINKGSRNSGKGVITKLLQNAFKIYIGIFNSGVLVRKQNENADDAKNLSWAVKLKDKRLIISQEVQEDAVLNGRPIKQIASGGDTMLGRCNYKDEIEFTPQFTMMLQLNEIKGVEPADALETCEQFYCKSKFVDEKDLIEGQPFLKLKDDNIKMLLEQKEIIDAFTIYVLEHFQDYMPIPDSVKFSTEDIKSDIPITLEQVILKYYRYSPNRDDIEWTEDIKRLVNEKYAGNVDIKLLPQIITKCISSQCREGDGRITTEYGTRKRGFRHIITLDIKEKEEKLED